MKVNLLTDAPKHNLALMKYSSWFKHLGYEVALNEPIFATDAEESIGSWLFFHQYPSIEFGGTAIEYDKYSGKPIFKFPAKKLPSHIEDRCPDYDLFGLDFSLGYTWRYCPRNCGFCVVPKQNNPKVHCSIWNFHDTSFRKICLLNNNTFTDPRWRETFEEIWEARLTVLDENGYDLRLLDDEKAEALKGTRFDGQIHFAWDCMKDEAKIIQGLEIVRQYKLDAMVYVLMGYDTTPEEDLYRCQKIHDHGFDPFPMLYKQTRALCAFRRFIYLRYYRRYKTLAEAWADYGRKQGVLGSGK